MGQKYRPHLEPELLEMATGTQAHAQPPHIVTMSCEVDIDTGRSLGPPVILRVSDVGRGIAEGPHIYKKDGWYYLLTAEGGTESLHRAIITRSRSPLGPYDLPPDGEGINPLVFNGDHPEVRNTGHADMVQGPEGAWWAVLLGVRPQQNGVAPLGRETFLVPVQWPDGGWPVFNKGQPVSLRVDHDLPSTPVPAEWRDDFDTGACGSTIAADPAARRQVAAWVVSRSHPSQARVQPCRATGTPHAVWQRLRNQQHRVT